MVPISEGIITKDAAVIEDFLVSAHTDSEDEDFDEEDALSASCHGNHFKRMFDEGSDGCDAQTIKKRKLQTQLQLLSNGFSAITVETMSNTSEISKRKMLVPCRSKTLIKASS